MPFESRNVKRGEPVRPWRRYIVALRGTCGYDICSQEHRQHIQARTVNYIGLSQPVFRRNQFRLMKNVMVFGGRLVFRQKRLFTCTIAERAHNSSSTIVRTCGRKKSVCCTTALHLRPREVIDAAYVYYRNQTVVMCHTRVYFVVKHTAETPHRRRVISPDMFDVCVRYCSS